MFDTIIAEMKNVRTLRKRRAVSPVIATVIIVAVTITVAVAVSYWMSGIAGQYTSFEKVEIQSALCDYFAPSGEQSYWKIEIKLKNSGTKAATLTDVFVNDVLALTNSTYAAPPEAGITASVYTTKPKQIDSGASDTVFVWIASDGTYIKLSAGTTINIKIHSATGMDYIRLVQLT